MLLEPGAEVIVEDDVRIHEAEELRLRGARADVPGAGQREPGIVIDPDASDTLMRIRNPSGGALLAAIVHHDDVAEGLPAHGGQGLAKVGQPVLAGRDERQHVWSPSAVFDPSLTLPEPRASRLQRLQEMASAGKAALRIMAMAHAGELTIIYEATTLVIYERPATRSGRMVEPGGIEPPTS